MQPTQLMVKEHMRSILRKVKIMDAQELLELELKRQKHVRRLFAEAIENLLRAFAELEAIATKCPPELLTPEEFKQWEGARRITEQARIVAVLLKFDPEKQPDQRHPRGGRGLVRKAKRVDPPEESK